MRSCRARAPWAFPVVVLALAACQSYNFNPVGHCLIQPGVEQYPLANISTADVLFVVDDSGSMGGEQSSLATAFSAFINNLDRTNAERVAAGLDPLDFHLAVTTTSVFWNSQTATMCRNDCPGASGTLVCCLNTPTQQPARQPKACTPGVTACPSGTSCSSACNSFKGENYCCAADGTFPPGSLTEVIPCSRAGTACGTFERHFNFAPGCTAGVAVNGWPFAQGDFVSWTSGASANPRVLHFDKSLYPKATTGATLHAPCADVANCSAGEVCVAATTAAGAPKFCRASCGTCASGFTCVSGACQPTNAQSFTSQELVNFFAGTNANVVVGTCGSGEEQGLQGAQLALQKALAGQQKDTYAISSGKVQTWDGTARTASSAAQWPHNNSKLVLIFVGDEDDCSSPQDPSGGVVMLGEAPGADACVHDSDTTNPLYAPPLGGKKYDVARFVDYFTSLGRSVGAAFIESAAQTQCGYVDPVSKVDFGACTPGQCCQPNCPSAGTCSTAYSGYPNYCGGQAAGTRFYDAATQLQGRGAEVVTGSICDPSFSALLDQIAEIVKPPTGLELPTLPAGNDITVLRIIDASGQTRKICSGPLFPSTPTNYTLAQAESATPQECQNNRCGWWFTATNNRRDPAFGIPVTVSQSVYINPGGGCIANPGETYSAEYIGRLPEGGCVSDADCRTTLGGSQDSWTCFAGMTDVGSTQVCKAATAGAPGTCLCGARSKNCPNG